MKSKIIGTTLPMVELTMNRGERIFAQPGAMQWMSEHIDMQADMQGGLLGGFKRSMSGEKVFIVYFESGQDNSTLALGHSFPGKILEMNISEKTVICQKRAFLAATEHVNYDLAYQNKLSTGLFGGEGFIMQKLSGQGTAWVEMDGEYVVKDLKPREKIRMETGALGMYEEGMDLEIERVKGVRNMFFGGEGLFITTITGPGKVWIQTCPAQSLAGEILPFIPSNRKGNS